MYNLDNTLLKFIETQRYSMKPQIQIQKANQDHISALKAIADDSRDHIGFVPRAKFQEAIDSGRIYIAVVNRNIVGFVIFRHRKTDQQTTLSEICVAPDWRGQGVGKRLVQALQDECEARSRSFVQLKCPVDLRANIFYKKLGFTLIATEPGRLRRLYVWRLPVKQGK